jgi:hypothetical protein
MYDCSLRLEQSRWYGYLQSLPQETVDIAVLWGTKIDVEDRKEALHWTRGTELEKQLRSSKRPGLIWVRRAHYVL